MAPAHPIKKTKLAHLSAKKNAQTTKSRIAHKDTPRNPKVPRPPTPPPSKKQNKPQKVSVDKGKGVERGERSTTLPTTFKVVAGSYEKLLYGLEGKFEDKEGNPSDAITLKPVFIFPAHVSSVKAVAASPDGGKWLATGSTDEIIKIWDLRRRKEVGGLMQHQGSITYLGFPTRSMLVSASEDGTICIFRARDWVLLRSLKGHKGRVNCVAVHPSGKVGLSVGKDRTLRMWDLMRGKGSASTKIGKEGELVRWSQKGDCFVVQAEKTLDVYSTSMNLLHTITHPSRIQDVRFVSRVDGEGELLLVGAEDKKVTVYDVLSASSTSMPVVAEFVGHTNRVKSMDALKVSLPHSPSSSRSSTTLLCTVSSDGWIRVFDLASVPVTASASSEETKPAVLAIQSIGAYDTKGTRLTCCTLADGEVTTVATNAKRKRDEDGETDGSESDVEDEDVLDVNGDEDGEDQSEEEGDGSEEDED